MANDEFLQNAEEAAGTLCNIFRMMMFSRSTAFSTILGDNESIFDG
jgi:hypothetical protein